MAGSLCRNRVEIGKNVIDIHVVTAIRRRDRVLLLFLRSHGRCRVDGLDDVALFGQPAKLLGDVLAVPIQNRRHGASMIADVAPSTTIGLAEDILEDRMRQELRDIVDPRMERGTVRLSQADREGESQVMGTLQEDLFSR
jgi:hypothetical protein